MKRKMGGMALFDMSERSEQVWIKICEDMDGMHPVWMGLNNRQVVNVVRNVRRRELGTGIVEKLEEPCMSKVKDSNFFLHST